MASNVFEYACIKVQNLCGAQEDAVCLPLPVQTVCLQKDGVHLTPEGQKVMYDAIFNTIETKLSHVR